MTEEQGVTLLASVADLQEICKALGMMLGTLLGAVVVLQILLCVVIYFQASKKGA